MLRFGEWLAFIDRLHTFLICVKNEFADCINTTMSLEFQQIPYISTDHIAKKCSELIHDSSKISHQKLVIVNQLVVEQEIAMFPLCDSDYSENKESLEWYVEVVKKVVHPKYLKPILRMRTKLRICKIETAIMKKLGFTYAYSLHRFPEGDKYAKLYDLYEQEKDESEKKKLEMSVMIAQKKWKHSYGWFPEEKHIIKQIAQIDKLISIV